MHSFIGSPSYFMVNLKELASFVAINNLANFLSIWILEMEIVLFLFTLFFPLRTWNSIDSPVQIICMSIIAFFFLL